MVFEEKSKELNIMGTNQVKRIRFDLEAERENRLQVIRKVYSKNVKKISRTKLIKMAIDNLVNDLEEQASEEEAIEYLRTLYKEAEF